MGSPSVGVQLPAGALAAAQDHATRWLLAEGISSSFEPRGGQIAGPTRAKKNAKKPRRATVVFRFLRETNAKAQAFFASAAVVS